MVIIELNFSKIPPLIFLVMARARPRRASRAGPRQAGAPAAPESGACAMKAKHRRLYVVVLALMVLGSLLIGLAGVRGRDFQTAADS